MIPAACQYDSGGQLRHPTMWMHNINTLMARNIAICNKLAPFVNGDPNATISKASTSTMQASDWAQVISLATNGIQQGDVIFDAHSTPTNTIFSAAGWQPPRP